MWEKASPDKEQDKENKVTEDSNKTNVEDDKPNPDGDAPTKDERKVDDLENKIYMFISNTEKKYLFIILLKWDSKESLFNLIFYLLKSVAVFFAKFGQKLRILEFFLDDFSL